MRYFALVLLLLLAACGGGEASDDRRAFQPQVSFYGDSLTYDRTADITAHKFLAVNYAKWGESSFAPLHEPTPVAVLRYGMADAIRGIPPETTVANLLRLKDMLLANGVTPIIVGMPCLEGELGASTAAAVNVVADVQVTQGCESPLTTDGIHPTWKEHARMDAIIRDSVLQALKR